MAAQILPDRPGGLAAVATQSSCKGGSLGDREGKGQRRKGRGCHRRRRLTRNIAITVRTLTPSRTNAAITDAKLYQDSEGDLHGYWRAIRIVARWSPI